MRRSKNVSQLLAVAVAVVVFSGFSLNAQTTGTVTPTPSRMPSLSTAELIKRGTEYYDKKDYELAFNNYAACFRIDPKAAHCAFNMGLARRGQSRFADAIRHYDDAIRLRPDWGEPYRERGRAYAGSLKWSECIADTSAAMAKGDKSEAVYTVRADCRRWLGQHKEAVEDLNAAIAISPRVTSLNMRGHSLAQIGRDADAFTDLDRTKDIAATGFEQHKLRGELALKLGKYNDAVAAFDRAIDTAPPLRPGQPKAASVLPDLYFKKGQALGKSGRAALAFDAYTASLSHLNSAEVRKARDNIYTLLTPTEKAAADVKLGRKPKPSPRTPAVVVAKTKPTPVLKRTTPAKPTTPTPKPKSIARVTKPDPKAVAAKVTTVGDGYEQAVAAVAAKDHPLVVALTTRSLELLPMKGKHQPVDDLSFSIYTELLKLRARARSEVGDHAGSDRDYFDITDAAMKETLRLMQASNAAIKNDLGSGTEFIMASVNSAFSVITCKSGFQTGIEWMDLLKAKRPNDTAAGIRAGIGVLGLREMCASALLINASNKIGGSKMAFANRSKLLNEALESYAEAITFTPRDADIYTRRAKLYREMGQASLAATDEAKARELLAKPR